MNYTNWNQDKLQINQETLDFVIPEKGKYFVHMHDCSCPECGTEWYGLWKTGTYNGEGFVYKGAFTDAAVQEIEQIKNLEFCPVCGGHLPAIGLYSDKRTEYDAVIDEHGWSEARTCSDGEKWPASSIEEALREFILERFNIKKWRQTKEEHEAAKELAENNRVYEKFSVKKEIKGLL